MTSHGNPGAQFDPALLGNVNLASVNQLAKNISSKIDLFPEWVPSSDGKSLEKSKHRAAWILKAVTLIDLTTLAGDDSFSNVSRLCLKAARPVAKDVLKELGFDYGENSPIHTAAVCVYPNRVHEAVYVLEKIGMLKQISVASVATGFPAGQTPLNARLAEIRYAVENGATEIDIVINRPLALAGKWKELFDEIGAMKEACGPAHLKTILATGELGTLQNVYNASMVAMLAGADFIKTSTGKESVNATIPVGIVMARAIKDYQHKTGFKVGLKPAGGVRTSTDALQWLILVKELLGNDWLSPELFRFGASGLLGDLETQLYQYVTGRTPSGYEFIMG